MHYFLAKQLTQQIPQPEDTEELTVKKLALQQVFTMVNNGQITDAVSIAALQRIELMMHKNQW